MTKEEEYKVCSEEIFAEYQLKKNIESDDVVVICQHIGEFSQHLLISIISLLDNALLKYGESKAIKKRLLYLAVECIQNIINHSDKLLDTNHLAYIVVKKTNEGYTINCSNTILSKDSQALEKKLDALMSANSDIFTSLFSKLIQEQNVYKTGQGGIGLLTIVTKANKEIKYEVVRVSKNYSFFNLEIKLKYKNYI